jgi:hypothetical protein
MGLEHWDQRSGAFRLIRGATLSRLLRLRLQDDNRLATTGDPRLQTPPLDVRDPRRASPKIGATVFPRWFVCDAIPGDPPDRRRLVRFQQPEAPKRLDYRGDDSKHRRVSPIRFVCGARTDTFKMLIGGGSKTPGAIPRWRRIGSKVFGEISSPEGRQRLFRRFGKRGTRSIYGTAVGEARAPLVVRGAEGSTVYVAGPGNGVVG